MVDGSETDAEILTERALRPGRAQLAAARAAVAGVEDARAAWEALAARGLIPMEWVGDAGRGFVARVGPCAECDGCGWVPAGGAYDDPSFGPRAECRRCRATGWSEQHATDPASVGAAVALASDPRGAQTAEALAREVLARSGPWGERARDRVVWCVGDPARLGARGAPWHPRLYDARVAYAALTGAASRPAYERLRAALEARLGAASQPLLHDAACAYEWRALCELGLTVPPEVFGRPLPEALVGHRYAELPDPFLPALELWATGYALDAVTSDAIVLFAPEVPPAP